MTRYLFLRCIGRRLRGETLQGNHLVMVSMVYVHFAARIGLLARIWPAVVAFVPPMSLHLRWAAWTLFCAQVVQIVKSVQVNPFWLGMHWPVMHDCRAQSRLKTSRYRFFFGQSSCTYFNPKIISWKSGSASLMSF